ncbi:MAG: hypothetical protein WBY44_08105 [Bryobacteraceae bacterium]
MLEQVIRNTFQVIGSFRGPAQFHLRAGPSSSQRLVKAPADLLVCEKIATVSGGQSLRDLANKPFVIVDESFDCLARKSPGVASLLRR